MNETSKRPLVLFVEPFYGGSHKVLIDTLIKDIPKNEYNLITLPAKKWHWRARCGALILSTLIPKVTTEKVLFCSSVLNLTELCGLRSDLQQLKKVVYFHENQLVYPIQEIKSRDVQYAYNQIITSLTADIVLFNSRFNMTSFLENISRIIKMLPDNRPKNIKGIIENKSKVLYFPMEFPKTINTEKEVNILHIVWPHRWEFDKGPEDFYNVLLRLKSNNCKFKLFILGEAFLEKPNCFELMKTTLKDEIVKFGYMESIDSYFEVLRQCHVVVSTAKHEFFGVSMMEATYCGCFPLVPNDLVYPEIYPTSCLFKDVNDLHDRLREFCENPRLSMELRSKLNLNFEKYSKNALLPDYKEILNLS